jgi:hypothetical protein
MKPDIKILLLFCLFCVFISCQKSNKLNGNWKNCGDNYGFSDVLVFNNFVRNYTVFFKNDSAIATVEKISFDYGEKKLYVKSLNNHKIYRFCEK